MSTSNAQQQRDASTTSGAAYASRDHEGNARNWWGEDRDNTPDRVGHDPQPFDYQSEKASWLAHGMLKDTAKILSATTLFETPYYPGGSKGQSIAFVFDDECNPHNELAVHEENERCEMTDPEVHVPSEAPESWGEIDYGQSRHRYRVDEEHGYLGRIMIADQPEEKFLDAVYGLIDWWACVKDLREQEAAKLRRDARRMKRSGDQRDVDIVEALLEDVMTDTILESDSA